MRRTELREEITKAAIQGLPMKQIKNGKKDAIARLCHEEFGCTYEEYRISCACQAICEGIRARMSSAAILSSVNISSCKDDLSKYRRFCKRYMLPSYRLRSLIGGNRMTENAEKVWNYLLGRKSRMTAHQISVGTDLTEKEVGQAIGELRHLGVQLVSMPGRSHGGYIIGGCDGAKELSEAWINNWRSSRGLAATFSYANVN